MKKFNLEGIYNRLAYPHYWRSLEGEIEILDKYFEGEIRDSDLQGSKRFVRGHFYNQNGNTNMDFMKANKSSSYSDLIHTLSADIIKPDSFEGKYEGVWAKSGRLYEFKKSSEFFSQNFDPKVFRNSQNVGVEIYEKS